MMRRAWRRLVHLLFRRHSPPDRSALGGRGRASPKPLAPQAAFRVDSVYREAQHDDDSLDETELDQIEEAISRVALEGWSVRRISAHAWKLIDERDPSAFWIYEYTIIAFASPRGLLVLHGRVVGPQKPWEGARSFGEGTFMSPIEAGGLPPASHQFRDIDSFLAWVFQASPPNVLHASRGRGNPAAPSTQSIEEIVERALTIERIHERFEVERSSADTWTLVPREEKSGVLDHDYRITRTRGPDALLVSCENSDGGVLMLRSEHVVYIPPEELFKGWLRWILRHKEPNTWGYS